MTDSFFVHQLLINYTCSSIQKKQIEAVSLYSLLGEDGVARLSPVWANVTDGSNHSFGNLPTTLTRPQIDSYWHFMHDWLTALRSAWYWKLNTTSHCKLYLQPRTSNDPISPVHMWNMTYLPAQHYFLASLTHTRSEWYSCDLWMTWHFLGTRDYNYRQTTFLDVGISTSMLSDSQYYIIYFLSYATRDMDNYEKWHCCNQHIM